MVLVRADERSEAGVLPAEDMTDAMDRYNDELVRAGVLLAGEGLRPSTEGARVTFSGGRATVTEGPFAEAGELIAGYWLIEVSSKAEAVQWATRIPFEDGAVELRRVFDATDHPAGTVLPGTAGKERTPREERPRNAPQA